MLPRLPFEHPAADLGAAVLLAVVQRRPADLVARLREEALDERVVREGDVEGGTDRLQVPDPHRVPVDVEDRDEVGPGVHLVEGVLDDADALARRQRVRRGV